MNTRERTRFIFVVLLLVLSFMILVGYGPREAELQVAGGLIVIYFGLNAYYSWCDQNDRDMKAYLLMAFVVTIFMVFYFS